ncbi:PREDICTED: tryptophan aminotransferase-related protein 4 [Fragaria vesca subsp. vesca]|uniref:tryptophan aminotransferase-related protein 4 n=1 Tax=Fragaria vesca subsp. vesca TaxID=101020 RepID=UPI0002C2F1DA|nr:PREDICTED: tryptophan aminotransferase-related protein 4 [Fragaria vesca subsp. vesca]
MAKLQQSSYVLCLAFSVAVNLYLILNLYGHGAGGQWELSWSRRAAEEAEHVAAVPCSGHGRAYLDGLVLDDGKQPGCECNSCFGGSDCSQFLTDCESNADGGDPYFLEPFWMEHASESAILVAGWHRMGYSFSDKSYISQELERLIRKVHDVAGNAVTQGRYIVIGAGSTHLINAAVQALSSSSTDNFNSSSSSPASIVVTIPYYALYETQTEYFQSVNYKFEGDGSLLNLSSGTKRVIEFVTAPNNPDGKLNKANFQGPNSAAIYDRVYYWPHFTPIPTPANDDVMVFSISKLTGHAGTRLGWAVIKDEAVYQRILQHTLISNLGISRDAQLRAMKLLNVVVEGGGKEIFEFGYTTMRKRWEKLKNTLSLSNRFSLQKDEPLFCTFFQKRRGPSPAYAWVKCEREEDVDCYKVLQEEANVYGRRGSVFGAEDRYVRLALIRSQDDFDILLHRLNQLVSKEDDSQPQTSINNVTTHEFLRRKSRK